MKKLIIIGNGFDKAHGMKTDYSEFMKSYLEGVREEFYSTSEYSYSDELLTITTSDYYKHHDMRTIVATNPVERTVKDEELSSKILDWFGKYFDEKRTTFSNDKGVSIKICSELFKSLYKKHLTSWIDIENEYFQTLVDNSGRLDIIDKTNLQFTFIRKQLFNYLKVQQKIHKDSIIREYAKKFTSNKPEQIMFLNFNYTNTLHRYLDDIRFYLSSDKINVEDKHNVHINYIHGSLDHQHGEPIFGIGDEHHSDYINLKDHENLISLFKYNKSNWYLKRDNYTKLTNFLDYIDLEKSDDEDGKFDIEIYGHSCGISDRTLFRYLVEHRNCNKIAVYHYDNESNFTNNTIELLRHFKDPEMFREKVLPYDESRKKPQLSKKKSDELKL